MFALYICLIFMRWITST